MSASGASPAEPLPEIVRCSDCAGPLAATANGLDCGGCRKRFPIHDGIPWLYRDVEGSRAQWAAKLQLFRQELLGEVEELETAAAESDLLPATRERLARQKAGLEHLGEQIFALLAPFGFSHGEAGGALPRDRIPSRQHVTSYLETVFRDWCWGEAEIAQMLELVRPHLPRGDAPGHALVLGGGAGRFAWELAHEVPFASVLQLDLNPLLTRIGREVASGETVELTELPRFPQGLDHVAVDQHLARPTATSAAPIAPLHYLLGDAFAPPLAPESLSLLATPWFVDIVPEDFGGLARRLGHWLAPGGRWLSFGPLSFESQAPEDRLTPEEMGQALEAAGFAVEHTALCRVDYLHSPHAMGRRGEEVFLFVATRGDAVAEALPFDFYPEWMIDGRQPIPALELFDGLRAERTFDVEILKCIDGRASIEDIVVMLSSRYGLERGRCRNTVNRFFSRLFEEEAPGGRA